MAEQGSICRLKAGIRKVQPRLRHRKTKSDPASKCLSARTKASQSPLPPAYPEKPRVSGAFLRPGAKIDAVAELLGDTLSDPMILLSWSEIKKLAKAVRGIFTPQAAKTAAGLSDDAARAVGGAMDDAFDMADDVPDLLPGAKAGADDALGVVDDWDEIGEATDVDRALCGENKRHVKKHTASPARRNAHKGPANRKHQ